MSFGKVSLSGKNQGDRAFGSDLLAQVGVGQSAIFNQGFKGNNCRILRFGHFMPPVFTYCKPRVAYGQARMLTLKSHPLSFSGWLVSIC
jgi:hypothetical protein